MRSAIRWRFYPTMTRLGRNSAALGATGDESVRETSRADHPARSVAARLRDHAGETPKLLKAIAERASAAPLLNELLEPERNQELDTSSGSWK